MLPSVRWVWCQYLKASIRAVAAPPDDMISAQTQGVCAPIRAVGMVPVIKGSIRGVAAPPDDMISAQTQGVCAPIRTVAMVSVFES